MKSKKKEIVVVASGYFDPIHPGHIEYLKKSKKLGDKLIVVVNNDKQADLKKGGHFMPLKDRKKILKALEVVDDVFVSIDKDRSISRSLAKIKPDVFSVGRGNKISELSEKEVCKKHGIKIANAFLRHRGKKSSSKILHKYVKKKIKKHKCKCGSKIEH